jgi:hypothetical protein
VLGGLLNAALSPPAAGTADLGQDDEVVAMDDLVGDVGG